MGDKKYRKGKRTLSLKQPYLLILMSGFWAIRGAQESQFILLFFDKAMLFLLLRSNSKTCKHKHIVQR